MQCLANTPFFKEYFANLNDRNMPINNRESLFTHHINTDNPLGHKGKIAKHFGIFIHQMWTDDKPITPTSFKKFMGKVNEQFAGRDQQDSQEFLSFVLDGLHEDMNL